MSNPFQRTPLSPQLNVTLPSHGHQLPSRKPSIVELLSSPPPLSHNDEEIHSLSLSRNTLTSSRASSISHHGNALFQQNPTPSTPVHLAPHQNHHASTMIDWSEVSLSELTELGKLISINASYSVQAAFETLISHDLTSIPVSYNKKDLSDLLPQCLTFDYSDLITYLLLIMNKVNVNELNVKDIQPEIVDPKKRLDLILNIISKAKKGEEVPVEFIIKLHPKNPLLLFKELDTLFKVMEALGNGTHRIGITDDSASEIRGILSQRRLIKFMWENARRFPLLDFYLTSTLQDLKIGSTKPITIYEDQLLIDALRKMFDQRVSSLAVIDRQRLLIGNISVVDVKHVSTSKNSHLLYKPVLSFISYNLSQKGIEEGQDQYPIFHVNNQTSLGRVIAKLVATQSHRLWIVDTRQNGQSPSTVEAVLTHGHPSGHSGHPATSPSASPTASIASGTSVGKLVGVVTLTDILGLFASSKGTKTDPLTARNQRRRSSTSTTRSSFDSEH